MGLDGMGWNGRPIVSVHCKQPTLFTLERRQLVALYHILWINTRGMELCISAGIQRNRGAA